MKTKRVVFDFENADYDKIANCILSNLSYEYNGGKYANFSTYCTVDFGTFNFVLDMTFIAPILGTYTDVTFDYSKAMLIDIDSCYIEDKGDVEYEFAYDNIKSFLSVELRKAFKRIARKAKKQAA